MTRRHVYTAVWIGALILALSDFIALQVLLFASVGAAVLK